MNGGVGYCIHCKVKVELKDAVRMFYKNGVPAERGICPKCGGKVLRILTTAERALLKEQQLKEQTGEQTHE